MDFRDDTIDEGYEIAPAVDESQEMDLLRLENDVLRRKLATLEKTVQDLEQDSEFRRHDMPDIEKLSTLLLKAKDAKTEALKYKHEGRDQLKQQVYQLTEFLNKAKIERQRLIKELNLSAKHLALEKAQHEDLRLRFNADQEIFSNMISTDRDKFTTQITELQLQMEELEKKNTKILRKSKYHQDMYLQQIRKLTRQLLQTKREYGSQIPRTDEISSGIDQLRHLIVKDEIEAASNE